MSARKPHILGLGGAGHPNSSTERFLRLALDAAEEAGASTSLLGASALQVPMYRHGAPQCDLVVGLVDELRKADGYIIASPAYHGTISGLVKNALDYVEETREDVRPYFSGRAVGCMAVAGGWQAAVTAMTSLRGIVHALRGWPTPLGIAINSNEVSADGNGRCDSVQVTAQIRIMAGQVVDFALSNRR
jgi:FMN reductase